MATTNGRRENPNLKMISTSLTLTSKVLHYLVPSFLPNRPLTTQPHQLSRSSIFTKDQAPSAMFCASHVLPCGQPDASLSLDSARPAKQTHTWCFHTAIPSCSNPAGPPLLTPQRSCGFYSAFITHGSFSYMVVLYMPWNKGLNLTCVYPALSG